MTADRSTRELDDDEYVVDDYDDADGDESGSSSRPVPRQKMGVGPVTTMGIMLMIAGLAMMGWVGYQYFGTDGPSKEAASEAVAGLEQNWGVGDGLDVPDPQVDGSGNATGAEAGPTSPYYTPEQLEKAMAILTIPRFGPDYKVPIIVGTTDRALANGVGWYSETALPGQLGNFAIAGHRITHGQPFSRLLELQAGDQIIVETKGYVFTYVMDNSPANLTVKDTESWVLDPVPGKPGAKPTQSVLTMTTCQDLFRSPDRSIGFAHLGSVVKK